MNHACDGAHVTVNGLKVENDGFELVPLTRTEQNSTDTPEYLRLRGYRIENHGAQVYEFTEPETYSL